MWRDRNLRKPFETAAAAAGLDDFRFHDLRHSFASSFMMRGGSVASLREILGHASIAMTLRYSHLSPAHLRGEMERTAVRDRTTSAQDGRIDRERAATT